MAHSSGVLGSTLTSMDLPLIVKRAIAFPSLDCGAGNICQRAPEGKRQS
jgi:hypothetical protein